jgi:hypothetical protein
MQLSLNIFQKIPLQRAIGSPLDPLSTISESADINQEYGLHCYPAVIVPQVRRPDGKLDVEISMNRLPA